jgi:hypothetical protein
MGSRRAESPLTKLARLLGGVVLMRGRLGHQVLGQLLVSDLRESELAGASVVMAAGSRRKSTLARAAIGTAAPAFALERHYGKVSNQLERRRVALAAREQAAREPASSAGGVHELVSLRKAVAVLQGKLAQLEAENAALKRARDATPTPIAAASDASGTPDVATTPDVARTPDGATPPPVVEPVASEPVASEPVAREPVVAAPAHAGRRKKRGRS